MGMNYDYDEEAAGHADDFVNRIDQGGAFVGQFKSVEGIVSAEKGTEGMRFEFEAPGGATASFSIYTIKADGTKIFGFNIVQAMMTILGVKSLKAKEGKVQGWSDNGKRCEVDGDTYPDLCNKNIGVVLQKELYTNNAKKDSWRMNLQAVFHPESRLTASEIRERKNKPEKLEKMLRGLKVKDSRETRPAEPSQPTIGADEGSY